MQRARCRWRGPIEELRVGHGHTGRLRVRCKWHSATCRVTQGVASTWAVHHSITLKVTATLLPSTPQSRSYHVAGLVFSALSSLTPACSLPFPLPFLCLLSPWTTHTRLNTCSRQEDLPCHCSSSAAVTSSSQCFSCKSNFATAHVFFSSPNQLSTGFASSSSSFLTNQLTHQQTRTHKERIHLCNFAYPLHLIYFSL